MSNTLIFWFRRDLRLTDNQALYQALKTGCQVQPVFIFDRDILDKLSDKKDARVMFIQQTLLDINRQLAPFGASIKTYYASAAEAWEQIVEEFSPQAVYFNSDYEPLARQRDQAICTFLAERQIPAYSYKDQVIFEKQEVSKDNGLPYTVFTPYKNKWLAKYAHQEHQQYKSELLLKQLRPSAYTIPELADMGFEQSAIEIPPIHYLDVISTYAQTRDTPSLDKGTSHMGIHFRFGTVSIRAVVAEAYAAEERTFLSELIWREFFMMVLYHFPETTHQAFVQKYDRMVWRNNEEEFQAWCEGRTGYPLVDAGMRELNATGFMHNRVRMLVASFLCKHLLIDWRWGEAYFAEKLLDYDQSANIGNWQWAAGCGTDAAPYFRIFSPILQLKKFDPQLIYVKKWIPELGDFHYPAPIVDHAYARERCLRTYKLALNS